MTESTVHHYRVATSSGLIQMKVYETYEEAWATVNQLPGFYVVKVTPIQPVYMLRVRVRYTGWVTLHQVKDVDRTNLRSAGEALVKVLKTCSTVSDADYEITEVKDHE